MFRLTQSHLNRGDLEPLRGAIAAEETIDARGLELSSAQVRAIRDLLPMDPKGRRQFLQWNFEDSKFGEASDFGHCFFKAKGFQHCKFGDRVSFSDSVFTRALFRGASFGNDANFERVDFGVKADFHSARFGTCARFSHSRFQSSQFFSASFGSEVSFSQCVFGHRARFHRTRFGDRAGFTEAQFRSEVDFGGCYFGEKAQMAKVQFFAGAGFVGATFGSRARLTSWRVHGDLNMRSAHFLGPVSLREAEVEESAIFQFASFDGSIDIGNMHCRGHAFFGDVAINVADRFGPLHVDQTIDLSSAVMRSPCAFVLAAKSIDFSDARFLAPLRITVSQGDITMDRLQNASRLVLSKPQPIGVKTTAPRLVSVQGADLGSVVVAGLDVRALHFQAAEGIDGLQIESGISFHPAPRGLRTHREVIAEEHVLRAASDPTSAWLPDPTRGPRLSPRKVDRPELARIYRGLRKAREDSRDAPGAADFYYGEMEMRRLEARAQLTQWTGLSSWALHAGNYFLLELYRLVGGYGVRPSRPLFLFVLLVLFAAIWIDSDGLLQKVLPSESKQTPTFAAASFEQCLIFVLRSALLLPSSAQLAAATGAEWIQICARVLGPLLIGLFAFGLRARVHR